MSLLVVDSWKLAISIALWCLIELVWILKKLNLNFCSSAVRSGWHPFAGAARRGSRHPPRRPLRLWLQVTLSFSISIQKFSRFLAVFFPPTLGNVTCVSLKDHFPYKCSRTSFFLLSLSAKAVRGIQFNHFSIYDIVAFLNYSNFSNLSSLSSFLSSLSNLSNFLSILSNLSNFLSSLSNISNFLSNLSNLSNLIIFSQQSQQFQQFSQQSQHKFPAFFFFLIKSNPFFFFFFTSTSYLGLIKIGILLSFWLDFEQLQSAFGTQRPVAAFGQ